MIQDYDALKDFVSRECDRHAFLVRYLRGKGLDCRSLQIAESKNIFIQLPAEQYDRLSRIKVLTAHYDRAPGSPGANDNSAAVFQLVALGKRLLDSGKVHNTLIIFTDHEELTEDNPSVQEQGAFKLGRFLAEREGRPGVPDAQYAFFNFDLCGVGDTLILSTANDTLLERSGLSGGGLHRQIRELQEAALDIMGRVRGCPYFTLETPFSDHIGLPLNRYPSVLIPLLPYQEAVGYRSRFRLLQKDMQSAGMLQEGRPGFLLDGSNPGPGRRIRSIIPRTWDRMHTDDDRIETLEEGAFQIMEELLNRIARTPIPLSRLART